MSCLCPRFETDHKNISKLVPGGSRRAKERQLHHHRDVHCVLHHCHALPSFRAKGELDPGPEIALFISLKCFPLLWGAINRNVVKLFQIGWLCWKLLFMPFYSVVYILFSLWHALHLVSFIQFSMLRLHFYSEHLFKFHKIILIPAALSSWIAP